MNCKNVTIRNNFQKGLMLIKEIHQNNMSSVIICNLKMLDLNFNPMFVTNECHDVLIMAYESKDIAILNLK